MAYRYLYKYCSTQNNIYYGIMHLQWDYSIFIVAIIPNACTLHLLVKYLKEKLAPRQT